MLRAIAQMPYLYRTPWPADEMDMGRFSFMSFFRRLPANCFDFFRSSSRLWESKDRERLSGSVRTGGRELRVSSSPSEALPESESESESELFPGSLSELSFSLPDSLDLRRFSRGLSDSCYHVCK